MVHGGLANFSLVGLRSFCFNVCFEVHSKMCVCECVYESIIYFNFFDREFGERTTNGRINGLRLM